MTAELPAKCSWVQLRRQAGGCLQSSRKFWRRGIKYFSDNQIAASVSFDMYLGLRGVPIQSHPRRPRGYQPGGFDIFGRKLTSRAEEPLGTYSYRTRNQRSRRKTLGTLAFPATKNYSVEFAYISYKKLRYTFDKSPEKIDGRVLVPSPHAKACNFLGLVGYFFLKLSTTIFPLHGPSN